MLLKSLDIFNTFIQSILIVWVCNNVTSKKNRISKFKSYIMIFSIFVEVVIFTYGSLNIPFANFLIVVLFLLIIILFFRKSDLVDSFAGFGLSYSIISLSLYFLSMFYQSFLVNLNFNIPTEIQILLFIYIPEWIIFIFIYKIRNYLFNAIIYLKSLNNSLVIFILTDFALIFLDTLHMEWTTESMGIFFKSILYFGALVTFVFTAIYFTKIKEKSAEVDMLNVALNNKIIELRKIKHDYGSEISSIYGLYQLGKMDRLGELLKSIVERYQTPNTAININIKANPIVASILNSAVCAGINVIVLDRGDYKNLSITNNDLLKLISNIIKNSIDALRGIENPIIKFRSYSNHDGIIITIVNNGPEIPKNIKDKLFEAGFSTKIGTPGDRGYGLSIVNDIIDNCSGKVSIESNKEYTQFKLEIPYKTS